MATAKKKTAAKKKSPAKPKEPEYDPRLIEFLDLEEDEKVSATALAAAHQALWGAQWRTRKEEDILVLVQQARGQRRP
tara:strand:- start:6253 stop:6486 length:234 start_codon:yes stop_codon:yes gene_type:complete